MQKYLLHNEWNCKDCVSDGDTSATGRLEWFIAKVYEIDLNIRWDLGLAKQMLLNIC